MGGGDFYFHFPLPEHLFYQPILIDYHRYLEEQIDSIGQMVQEI